MRRIMFVLLLCLFSCKTKQIDEDIECINMKSSEKEDIVNLFDNASIVDLETTDMSLVGLYISHIEIWDNKIFIQNSLQSHKNILCFDLNGKFLFKIDKMGQGPGEYTHLGGFFIDKNLNRLVLTCEEKRFLYFDLSGNFLHDVYANDLYFARQILYLNDSTCIAYNDATFLPDPKMSLLHLDIKTMNIRNRSNSTGEFFFCAGNKSISKYNDNIMCLAYNDTIYGISDINNAKAEYFVYYSDEQTAVKNFVRKNASKMDYMEQILVDEQLYKRGESSWISAMYETDIYLVFSCMRYISETDYSEDYILFYNKKTKKTYNSDNIRFGNYRLKNCSVRGVDGNTLYCVPESEITERDKENIQTASCFSEEDKKKILAHKYDDNPLILILK